MYSVCPTAFTDSLWQHLMGENNMIANTGGLPYNIDVTEVEVFELHGLRK